MQKLLSLLLFHKTSGSVFRSIVYVICTITTGYCVGDNSTLHSF